MWVPKKQKVLIVDDEPTNIKILSKIVEPYATVFFALSGEAALPIIVSKQPDLILLDIVMPGMDGYELIKLLKASDSTEKIPVIFVTEKREENEEIKGLNLGAIDYITKPLSSPIVMARVKNHLELKRHRDLFETLSSYDGLTGIPNRRFFDQTIETEWSKAIRMGVPLSLIMVDIDKFKEFNDHYGHLAGDECLVAISKLIHETAERATDFAARYGGEEFGIILPGLDLVKALSFAVKLKEKMHRLEIPHEGSRVNEFVTLSFGVASMVPTKGSDPKSLIKDADDMLYLAKERGRNQIQPLAAS